MDSSGWVARPLPNADSNTNCLDVLVGGLSDGLAERPAPSRSPTPSYHVQHLSEQRILVIGNFLADDDQEGVSDGRLYAGKLWEAFEPYIRDGKPLKIMNWNQMCSRTSSPLPENMRSTNPQIPDEALGCNITVQCRRATAKPLSLMNEKERQIREARLAVDAALSVGRSGDETNLFLGQEDQITAEMALGDVVDGRYDSDLMNVCVAQETILSSPQCDTSSWIVVDADGTVRKEGINGSVSAEPLAVLASWIRAPAYLLPNDKVRIREVNLWYAPKATRTNTHYDCHNNILVVLRGTKTIELCPPTGIKGSPLHSDHANHPALWRAKEVGGSCPIYPSFNLELQMTGTHYKHTAIVASVSAGEAIFIPEGWWHRVESSADCLAVNFWFDHNTASASVFARSATAHMLPYQAREVMRLYVKTNFELYGAAFMREAQMNADAFLPSSQEKKSGKDMVTQRMLVQGLLGCGSSDDPDVDFERVETEGYTNQELRICLDNIFEQMGELQKEAENDLDPTISDGKLMDLASSLDSLGLILSIFLIYVQPGQNNDRHAVMNLFANLFRPSEMKRGEQSVSQRKWLFLEIVLRLQRQACFILSQVWEQHKPAAEAKESFNHFFEACSDPDRARRHILEQTESFQEEVVNRIIVQDLMLLGRSQHGNKQMVLDTDEQTMRSRMMASQALIKDDAEEE